MEGTENGGIVGIIISLAPMILIFVAMYAILILPQRKKEKKMREMINSSVVGDKVITLSGVVGKIVNIKDDEFTIETSIEKTKITVKKWAIKEVDKPVSV